MADTKVMTIKCKKCKRKVFKYQKIGKGLIIKAYKPKIRSPNYQLKHGNLYCQCGHRIATDRGKYYKMMDQYKYE